MIFKFNDVQIMRGDFIPENVLNFVRLHHGEVLDNECFNYETTDLNGFFEALLRDCKGYASYKKNVPGFDDEIFYNKFENCLHFGEAIDLLNNYKRENYLLPLLRAWSLIRSGLKWDDFGCCFELKKKNKIVVTIRKD